MNDHSDTDLAVVVPDRDRETLPPAAPDTDQAPADPDADLNQKHLAELLGLVKGIDARHEQFVRDWHEAEEIKARQQDAFNEQVKLELRQINARLELGQKVMDDLGASDRFQSGEIATLRDEVAIVRVSQGPAPSVELPLHVLIVEDYVSFRRTLATRLTECGMHVVEADGIEDAAAALRRAAFDVAIIDLTVREGDAMPLVRTIRRDYPAVGTLILTGGPKPGQIREAKALGVKILTKPIDLVELVNEVKAARVAAR